MDGCVSSLRWASSLFFMLGDDHAYSKVLLYEWTEITHVKDQGHTNCFLSLSALTSSPVSNHTNGATTAYWEDRGREGFCPCPCNAAVLVGRMGMLSLSQPLPMGNAVYLWHACDGSTRGTSSQPWCRVGSMQSADRNAQSKRNTWLVALLQGLSPTIMAFPPDLLVPVWHLESIFHAAPEEAFWNPSLFMSLLFKPSVDPYCLELWFLNNGL